MREYLEEDREEERTIFTFPLNPNLDGYRAKTYSDDERPYIPPEEEAY